MVLFGHEARRRTWLQTAKDATRKAVSCLTSLLIFRRAGAAAGVDMGCVVSMPKRPELT
jgi:hypothetical protein